MPLEITVSRGISCKWWFRKMNCVNGIKPKKKIILRTQPNRATLRSDLTQLQDKR